MGDRFEGKSQSVQTLTQHMVAFNSSATICMGQMVHLSVIVGYRYGLGLARF